jgi:hypothetical protein
VGRFTKEKPKAPAERKFLRFIKNDLIMKNTVAGKSTNMSLAFSGKKVTFF